MNGAPSHQPKRPSPDEFHAAFQSIRARLRALTVAVTIMALALMLTAAAVFGSLANYFAGDPLLFGGISIAAALLGFVFGWVARRNA